MFIYFLVLHQTVLKCKAFTPDGIIFQEDKHSQAVLNAQFDAETTSVSALLSRSV